MAKQKVLKEVIKKSVKPQEVQISEFQKAIKPRKNKEILSQTVFQPQPTFSKYGFKTLDEITGDKLNPYEFTEESEYESFLNDLNQSDLDRHASEHSVLPRPDRHAVIKLLLREFRLKTSEYYNAKVPQPSNVKQVSQEVLKILSEGR